MVCGAAVLLAIRGEMVVAHKASLPAGDPRDYAGLAELLLVILLAATGILLFASILMLWLVAALRRSEWGWTIVASVVLAASVAFPVAVYTHSDFVLRASGELQHHMYLLLLLLVFAPLLAGLVPSAIYGFRPQDVGEPARLPGSTRSQPRLDRALVVLVLGLVLLGYVAWLLRLGAGIAFIDVGGPLVGVYVVPLGTALSLAVAMATALLALRSEQGAWAAGVGGLTLVSVVSLVIAIESGNLTVIVLSLAVSMVALPMVALAYGIFARRRGDGTVRNIPDPR
jgi:hypothetical protein